MATFPTTGSYVIKNFPFNTNSPNTTMTLKLDKINNTTYKLYCTMKCNQRSWDQGKTYSVSFVVKYYTSGGSLISSETVINKKAVYAPTVSPSSLWGKSKMYNWNFYTDNFSNYLEGARALGLTGMSYSSAKQTADANGLKYYSGQLMAGEPWGIRYLSDTPPTVVYAPQTLSYVRRPTNGGTSSWNYNWPSGYKRTDADKGVQFVIHPPANAAYFKGDVQWYQGSTMKDHYVIPEDGVAIPDDQKIETYSKLYYKDTTTHQWTPGASVWEKDSTTHQWKQWSVYYKDYTTHQWVKL